MLIDSFLCQYFIEWLLHAGIIQGGAGEMTEQDKVPGFIDFKKVMIFTLSGTNSSVICFPIYVAGVYF